MFTITSSVWKTCKHFSRVNINSPLPYQRKDYISISEIVLGPGSSDWEKILRRSHRFPKALGWRVYSQKPSGPGFKSRPGHIFFIFFL